MHACLILTLLALPAAADLAVADARLNDVCFVNSRQGWAVGDRGAIWHTDDGGEHWQLQNSPVGCNLHAVIFHDPQTGWAVGGLTHPYTRTSSGVVLATRDGGQSWSYNNKLVLPTLRRVGFFTTQRGWAAGCPSAMYPSGLFLTDDGGRSWRPLPGGDGRGAQTADLLDLRSGAVANPRGAVALVHGGEMDVPQAPIDLRRVGDLRLLQPAQGWLVGEGGLVKTTNDLGSSWQPPPALPSPSSRYFDFAAIATRGSHCWIAGCPGSKVFYTPDFGRTWRNYATGTPVPLRGLTFVDEQHGWAVGELGTILASSDGGRTWRKQRAGGCQAAMLALVATADEVPLELIARISGNDGYFSVVNVIGRRDVEVTLDNEVPVGDRLHEAVVRLGGSATSQAWQFPLRQPGLAVGPTALFDAWDRLHDGRGIEELHAHLVRQIRIWRPEVIVTGDANSGKVEDALLQQAVLQAVAQAADEVAFPAQILEAGLKPWRVSRVYAPLPPGARGIGELNVAQPLPGLGGALADAVAEPRGLLHEDYAPPPASLAFRLLWTATTANADRRDSCLSLSAVAGGDARRQPPLPMMERLEAAQKVATKRRNVQAILERAGRGAWSAEQLLGQLDELTGNLDPLAAGQILYQLADRYHHTGQWPAAAETFQRLLARHPDHPLATLAMLWLLQYYSSAEAAHRIHCDPTQLPQRFQLATAVARELERSHFELFMRPTVRFPLAAAWRGLGQPKAADRLHQMQPRLERGDGWWAAAQAELLQAAPKGRPPKPQLACARAATPPHLDGLLDDALWRQAKPVALRSAQQDDAEWPAAAMLAYDAEFLYLAVRCREAPNHAEESQDSLPATPRQRKADLSGQDRVEIFLDIDRDYTTSYHLAVDRRGWTNEDCWGDFSWTPLWFIATHRGQGEWTIEAAIPWKELSSRAPRPRECWAAGIQRVTPGVGFQSWSTPAAVIPRPDGFGLMVFD